MVEMMRVSDSDAIASMRRDYLASLRGPQEAWLEEQVQCRETEFWEFILESQSIGYCCVEPARHLLLQFYVSDKRARHAEEAFEEMLARTCTELAYVTTRDPHALSLCLSQQCDVALESYLFEHRFGTDCGVAGMSNVSFRVAHEGDIPGIVDASGDFWGDVGELVRRGHLRLLCAEDDILGMGYVSTGFCSEGTANLGVFTTPDFRRRGVGTVIVQELVRECQSRSLRPIAACYHENRESKATLARAGFVSHDRMFVVRFPRVRT